MGVEEISRGRGWGNEAPDAARRGGHVPYRLKGGIQGRKMGLIGRLAEGRGRNAWGWNEMSLS